MAEDMTAQTGPSPPLPPQTYEIRKVASSLPSRSGRIFTPTNKVLMLVLIVFLLVIAGVGFQVRRKREVSSRVPSTRSVLDRMELSDFMSKADNPRLFAMLKTQDQSLFENSTTVGQGFEGTIKDIILPTEHTPGGKPSEGLYFELETSPTTILAFAYDSDILSKVKVQTKSGLPVPLSDLKNGVRVFVDEGNDLTKSYPQSITEVVITVTDSI